MSPTPKRILFVETKNTVYGGQKALLARCSELKKRNIDYKIIHPYSSSEFIEQFARVDAPNKLVSPNNNWVCRLTILRLFYTSYQLIKAASLETPQVVHVDAFDSAYIVATLKSLLKLKNVTTVFTVRSERYLRFNAVDKFLLHRIDRLFTNSEFSQKQLSKAAKIACENIEVTYTPIDFTALFGNSAKKYLLKHPHIIRIGYMGSLEPRKRLDRFLTFGSKLASVLTDYDVELNVFGTLKKQDDRYLSTTLDEVQNKKSGPKVNLRGYMSPTDAQSAIDILFCPYDNEPLGRVVPEFLYMNTPVIVVNSGGLKEAGCGYAIEIDAKSETDLCDKFIREVQRLLNRRTFPKGPATLTHLQQSLDTRFSAFNVVQRELDFYEKIICAN